MANILDLAGALAAALALGAGVFVSFLLAPMVFKVLEAPSASKFLRAMFPRYYGFCLGCGAVVLVSGIGRPGVLSPAGVLIALAAASLALVGRINAARDAGAPAAGRFRRLHGLSVVINLAMLITSAWIVTRFAGA